FQSEKLEIKPNDKVLEIGTGSGYQACILLAMGANVYTIEYNQKLYERTRKFLPSIGYRPKFFHGDGSQGLLKHAAYDKIIVTAGAPNVPTSLINQLNKGGILMIPVGDSKKQQMLRLTKVDDKKIKKETFDNFSFVPLLGKEGW
ncbi:MAG: protein-L-isoaspartate O-methyltransferase, partial [Bacteroidota bacterium]